MHRPKPKKTGIGKTTEQTMRNALDDIKNNGLSVKAASVRHGVPRTTLRRYVGKFRHVEVENIMGGLTPNYTVRKVFSLEEEQLLCNYLQVCAKLHHGLTPKNVRSLAYELAVANNKRIPPSWNENKMAGKRWMTQFLKRNPLSIRTAEATSLGRAMGFNKVVVKKFFDNLKEVLDKYKFRSGNIYNMDESGLTTVQEAGKVVAMKGQKQVGQITSAERGTLITLCGAINADGNSVPPLLIFPRKYFKEHMLKGAPNGSIGAASPSGWISSEIFVQWMKHFISYTHPTENMPVLLIMDNHNSHVSLEAIKLAKENNVVLLTLPPHTSHKLQPLDRTVYGPLKTHYNNACKTWLTNHPGQRITIYDVSEILGQIYHLAFSSKNCVSGFKATGIFPYDENIFIDDDFIPSTVTDLPFNDSSLAQETESSRTDVSFKDNSLLQEPQPSSSKSDAERTPPQQFISPEILKPYPKSTKVLENKQQRKKKTTQILTSTPVYKQIEEEQTQKKARENSVNKSKTTNRNIFSDNTEKKKNDLVLAKKDKESSSSSNSAESLDLTDSDEVDWMEMPQNENEKTLEEIGVGSFVLVKFATKKQTKYCVGKVLEIGKYGDEFLVNFLRKRKQNKFSFPDVRDESIVSLSDMVMHLPTPITSGGTARTQSLHYFSVDLSLFSLY